MLDVVYKKFLLRISNIVTEIFEKDEIFKTLDKTELMEFFSNMIENSLSEQLFSSISDEKLVERIKNIMFIEIISNLLNDLTPKQKGKFEEIVKRRAFFE